MQELVEWIGKRAGYDIIEIHHNINLIDYNINEIVKAELVLNGKPAETDLIILTAIKYSLTDELKANYDGILDYIQNTFI